MHFNPRSREGSDHGTLSVAARGEYFNPRSREGSDVSWICGGSPHIDFNPRSREGSDVKDLINHVQKTVFQSTLP